MSIIISKNGREAKRIDKSDFGQEDKLQKYIYDNPESIPLYNIKENIRLLILAREVSTKSGPIDALGVDKDGTIYIIETKLYKNSDKRLVVAQVLDYGASIWHTYTDFSEFLRILDQHVNKQFKISLNQKLSEFFSIDDDQSQLLLDNVKKNLNTGNFKFVVLMDKLHDQLKDLILFLNQNSQFDIFAVEMEYYKYQDYEIIIPRLYGTEVKKEVSVSSRTTKVWDEESFFEQAKSILNESELEILKDIYNFAKKMGDVTFGTGITATFRMEEKSFEKNLFTIFSSGRAWVGVGWISQINLEVGKWLAHEIGRIGINIPQGKNLESAYPEFNIIRLNPEQIEVFKKIFESICQKMENNNLQQTQ
ncbi:hypothetical protein HYS31_01975 [Candidatus Woesearchaeota archaeon]|nr:hypothetical protein [Candidatus Woesearchaeota archaeon]